MKTSFNAREHNLGEILVHLNIITQDQLDQAVKKCAPNQSDLGQILVQMGFTTEEKILKGVSVKLGISYFTSFEGMIDPVVQHKIPEHLARKHLAVPVFYTDNVLTIGMINPLDIEAIDQLSNVAHIQIQPVMTTYSNLFKSIEEIYGYTQTNTEPKTDPAETEAAPVEELNLMPEIDIKSEASEGDEEVKTKAEEKSVVDLVDSIIYEGLSRKASDIHLESMDKTFLMRLRIDDMLYDCRNFTKLQEPAIIARIKILANMDITETRLPQDGHISKTYNNKKFDFRVSTLPTIHGEKAVLRILDKSNTIKQLTDLGFTKENLSAFERSIQLPNGLILVTGPTGSGKTTTLYAALNKINDTSRNIVTLEDPVEYQIDRINQVEANSRIGLTFASGLRSILRQDPNIILVGEIRDLETAEIAVQSSITGHLVLSTLHTNDAISTVHRLINMGIEPFLLIASLRGVMAQRLVRSLCKSCKKETEITPEYVEIIPELKTMKGPFYEAQGCEECLKTGYMGRVAIHEWLEVDNELKNLILKKASAGEIRAVVDKKQFNSLQMDALKKAEAGLTSISEVIRVTHENKDE